MLRQLLVSFCILLACSSLSYAQGALQGKIQDAETKEAIPFANIVIEAGGRQVGGATSDFDGKYSIKPIPPGKYDVKATYVGYKPLLIQGVLVTADKITFLDIDMNSTSTTLETFEVVDYKVPLIEKDGGSSGGTVTSEEIEKMSGRSASSVAVTVGGVFSQDGEMGSIRGQRTEGTVTYIDGVRVRGTSSLPKSALEQVSVITGGLPAQYGDATGGIVNITTKGASRKFGAGVEFVTSLDGFGYNLLGFNVQGPIIKGKDSTKTTSLLGFFLSGEVGYNKDTRPFSKNIQVWQASDEYLDYLRENPLRPSGTGAGNFLSAEYTLMDDLTQFKTKNNAENISVNLSGKIDVRTTETINLTFGGNLVYDKGRAYQHSYSLFNYDKFPEVINNTWRVFGRFTQRFKQDTSETFISNVYYSIQVDYSKNYQTVQDANHQDNLFNYGYIGNYKTHKIRSYELGSDTILGFNNIYIHNGFRDTLVEFTRAETNPYLANYTSQFYTFYDPGHPAYWNMTNIQLLGGLLNGQSPSSVYGIYANTGTQYNGYSNSDATQIGINANGSADVGNHAIQFGLQYEQRIDRYYGYAPVGLWTRMRQLANFHIEQLDKDNPHAVRDAMGVFQDTVYYDRLYDENSQSFFDYNLRQKLGIEANSTEWLDIDNYDPSLFTIDMFNADELLNDGSPYVSYYGFDHTGKVLDFRPSIDDFFTQRDEFGNFTRPIGAFEPIYMAGYISDKFAFRDLIFNIGIRVDRFDANQSVLSDPYLLFPAKTVKEVNDLGEHPGNMGDDFVVYVNDLKNPTAVAGYRNGSVWYDATGTEITDPATIETASGIAPYLVDPDDNLVSSKAFSDYEPQISYMPRISFSFPISDEALFFAHYDVLTKRPTTGNRLDPTDYLFIYQMGQNALNNPNLKPEKTIDYELGFQQLLNIRSSLKFSAYYREMRDLVQIYRFSGSYPISYISYNNIDFGTVKGMTIAYDLRRSNNVWIKANYTLQFADGTGSSATSAYTLVATGQPNLRTLTPLSFDRRHAVTAVVDYRFSSGSKYNGPKITRQIKGTDKVKTIALLENTGANFTFRAGSGIPYSKSSTVVGTQIGGGGAYLLEGSINGSRLPWQFTIDARVDRDIEMKFGKNKEKTAYINVYLQVLNVLNTENVMGVYRATGNPDDDGYLSAAEYQAQINATTNPESFRQLYALSMNSPYNYSLPRRIRLGVMFNF
jgi:hypothetical protein